MPLFFYSHLFLSHPELRSMFPVSMATQRDRLVGALGRIVSSVDQLDEVAAFIEQLGRDHRRFEVVAGHYEAVGASLLATLKHFLGERWTDEVAADWTEAYGVIASVMVAAAEASERTSPAWWTGHVTAVERRGLDIAVIQVRPEPDLTFVPGQSVAIEIPSRPRLWRYLSRPTPHVPTARSSSTCRSSPAARSAAPSFAPSRSEKRCASSARRAGVDLGRGRA